MASIYGILTSDSTSVIKPKWMVVWITNVTWYDALLVPDLLARNVRRQHRAITGESGYLVNPSSKDNMLTVTPVYLF